MNTYFDRQPKTFDAFKTLLNDLFKALRKTGITARQNFLCCGGCGSAQLHEWYKKGELARTVGYVFYHQQDRDNMVRTRVGDELGVYLCFGSFVLDEERTTRVGRRIVELAEELNLGVEWDGKPETRVRVFLRETTPAPTTKAPTVVSNVQRIMDELS